MPRTGPSEFLELLCIRRFGGEQESGYVYHISKVLLTRTVLSEVVLLALPVSLQILWLGAVEVSLGVGVLWSSKCDAS